MFTTYKTAKAPMFTTRVSIYRLVLDIGYMNTFKFVVAAHYRLRQAGYHDIADTLLDTWRDVSKYCHSNGLAYTNRY